MKNEAGPEPQKNAPELSTQVNQTSFRVISPTSVVIIAICLPLLIITGFIGVNYARNQAQDRIAFTNDITNADTANKAKNFGDIYRYSNDALSHTHSNVQKALAYQWRGWGNFGLGKNSEAEADENESIRLNPKDSNAYFVLGAAQDALGKKEEAVKSATQTIALDPSYAWGYNLRGVVEAELNNCKAAVADMNKAVNLDASSDGIKKNKQNIVEQCK